MTTSTPMTKTERTELSSLIRQRERLMKTLATQRSAELMADVEQQLARIYSWDEDETWEAATEAAQAAVEEAKVAIAGRCQELGIPPEFAPSLSMGWYGRGQNAVKDRRAELRRVAKTRIDATEKAARTQIETWSLEARTELVAPSLTSTAAQAFLQRLPSVDTLMPELDAKVLLGGGES